MLAKTILNSPVMISRRLSTSPIVNFKFKLTEDMSRQFEEQQKKKKKELEAKKAQPALHTRESSLIMGKVSSDRYKKVIKVGVPKHRLNEYLLMYFRELDNVHAFDRNDECKPGDWVLLRKQTEFQDEKVTHIVDRVVYKYGNFIDPITGRRSLGFYYDDDIKRLEKINVDL